MLLRRMLSPQPHDRPQTGREVVDAIAEIERVYGYGGSASSIARLASGQHEALDVIELLQARSSTGSASTSNPFGNGSREPQDDSITLARLSRSRSGTRRLPTASSSLAPRDLRSEIRADPALPQPTHPTKASTLWSLLLLLLLALIGMSVLYFVIKPS
jgi:hypothetical protein